MSHGKLILSSMVPSLHSAIIIPPGTAHPPPAPSFSLPSHPLPNSTVLTHPPPLRKYSTFESLHKELNEKQIALSKDPPVYPALEVPMYLLNLERDALMLQVEMGWESR